MVPGRRPEPAAPVLAEGSKGTGLTSVVELVPLGSSTGYKR